MSNAKYVALRMPSVIVIPRKNLTGVRRTSLAMAAYAIKDSRIREGLDFPSHSIHFFGTGKCCAISFAANLRLLDIFVALNGFIPHNY